jgi:hypothetical protein
MQREYLRNWSALGKTNDAVCCTLEVKALEGKISSVKTRSGYCGQT